MIDNRWAMYKDNYRQRMASNIDRRGDNDLGI